MSQVLKLTRITSEQYAERRGEYFIMERVERMDNYEGSDNRGEGKGGG